MNTHIMSNEKIYWFIFYNDQLLIEKKNGKYQIPYAPESPIKREMDIPDFKCTCTRASSQNIQSDKTYFCLGTI